MPVDLFAHDSPLSDQVGGANFKTRSPGAGRFLFYRGRFALYSLLRSLKIGSGDEVIVQAYTCSEVVQPILELGASPVFCDTEPTGFCLDPRALSRVLAKTTKAVIIQHTFGIPANLNALMPLLKQRGIFAIEDCCHVCASDYNGISLGSFGDAAFYSYGYEKPMSVGLGGAAVLNSPAAAAHFQALYSTYTRASLADEAWAAFRIAAKGLFPAKFVVWARDFLRGERGKPRGGHEPWSDRDCKKSLPRVVALCVDRLLQRTDRIVSRKERTLQKLDQGVGDLGLRHPAIHRNASAVLWRYPLCVRDKSTLLVRAKERAVGIVDWGSVPFQWIGSSDQRAGSGTLPNAQKLSETTVTIPISFGLSDARIRKVIRFLSQMKAEGLA
jgi:perosamine synthetase